MESMNEMKSQFIPYKEERTFVDLFNDLLQVASIVLLFFLLLRAFGVETLVRFYCGYLLVPMALIGLDLFLFQRSS